MAESEELTRLRDKTAIVRYVCAAVGTDNDSLAALLRMTDILDEQLATRDSELTKLRAQLERMKSLDATLRRLLGEANARLQEHGLEIAKGE